MCCQCGLLKDVCSGVSFFPMDNYYDAVGSYGQCIEVSSIHAVCRIRMVFYKVY